MSFASQEYEIKHLIQFLKEEFERIGRQRDLKRSMTRFVEFLKEN